MMGEGVSDVGALELGRVTDPVEAATPVRVLIADDAPITRSLLRLWLKRHGSLDLVAEATDGVEAVDLARRERPDLVLLDLSMPRMDGLEAAVEIRRSLPAAKIIIFSAFSVERMGAPALLAGADIYVEKELGPAGIFAAVELMFGVRPIGPVPPACVGMAEKLDPHETRWRVLLDALDQGVVVVGHDARVATTNHAATILFGIPTSTMIGRPVTDLFATAIDVEGRRFDADRLDPITETLTSGRPRSGVVVEMRHAAGERAWLSVNVRPLDTSEANGAQGAIASVTDETALRALRCELAARTAPPATHW